MPATLEGAEAVVDWLGPRAGSVRRLELVEVDEPSEEEVRSGGGQVLLPNVEEREAEQPKASST